MVLAIHKEVRQAGYVCYGHEMCRRISAIPYTAQPKVVYRCSNVISQE